MKWKHPHSYEGKKTKKKMFPPILNFRWIKFILTYDFSDFGLVLVTTFIQICRMNDSCNRGSLSWQVKKKKMIEHKLCYKQSWIYSKEHLWRRQWHPTAVVLPGKSHGRGSLVGWVGHDWRDWAAARNIFVFRYWMCCNIT